MAAGNPGSLDTSFGTDGIKDLSVGAGIASQITTLPNGKIIMAGLGGDGSNMSFLTLLNSDGSLDTSFGQGGTTGTIPIETNLLTLVLPNGNPMVIGV